MLPEALSGGSTFPAKTPQQGAESFGYTFQLCHVTKMTTPDLEIIFLQSAHTVVNNVVDVTFLCNC